jgi:hypothetical protein
MSEPTKNKAAMATANNMKIIIDLHYRTTRLTVWLLIMQALGRRTFHVATLELFRFPWPLGCGAGTREMARRANGGGARGERVASLPNLRLSEADFRAAATTGAFTGPGAAGNVSSPDRTVRFANVPRSLSL